MKKVLLVVVSLLFLVGIFYFWLVLKPVGTGEEKVFVVNQGESTISTAQKLEQQKIIRSRWLFLICLHLQGERGKIQAGSFRLSPMDSLPTIIRKLKRGRLDVWLTLIEGWRREQIAEKVEEKLAIPKKEFLAASRGEEGYLFPDSYLVPVGTSAEGVVSLLKKNFQEKWQLVWPDVSKRDPSKNQILILASLVEREAKIGKDRPIVAGILFKRWRSGWPLQVDATIQYAKANLQTEGGTDWWRPITRKDLSIKSLYNTYSHQGLPPTPICNPSLASIRAVVSYQPSDYWFYVSDKSGKIHFAKTLAEHEQNIKEFLIY